MSDGEFSAEDVAQLLADDGYSGDERKARLKQMLTEATQRQSGAPTPQRAELIDLIKRTIDQHQDGDAVAEDTL